MRTITWRIIFIRADSYDITKVFKWRYDRRSGNCNSSSCKLIRRKSRASMGFELMTTTLALQCSTNWAMKTHTLGAGHFVAKKKKKLGLLGLSHLNFKKLYFRSSHHFHYFIPFTFIHFLLNFIYLIYFFLFHRLRIVKRFEHFV